MRLGLPILFLLALTAACGGSDYATSTPSPARTTSQAVSGSTTTTPVSPGPRTDLPPAAGITVAAGFAAYELATGFSTPSSVSVGPGGTIYVGESGGSIKRLADNDGDGAFEAVTTFAEVPSASTGILATANGVYIGSSGSVYLAKDADGDGMADSTDEIVSGLPNGRHQNNGMALSADGKLYITNGSDCDDCDEGDQRLASILQANADGSDVRVYARGLRNPYDVVFDAQGRLWSTDNGSDEPCETTDELNLIIDGGDYGWPYGEDGCDNETDGTPPVADLGLHTASTGLAYYGASKFPAGYRGNFFATVWGTFFGMPTYTPRLLRIVVDESSGSPRGTVETFAEGFQHPIDVTVDGDGSLLVLDYAGEDGRAGALYRIVYTG
jgi:glucose/arabinose dehydrogenase